MKPIKHILGLTFIGLLSACGGGSPDGAVGSGSIGGGSVIDGATVAVAVINATGATVNSIALDGGYSVEATVKNRAGQPVVGKALSFVVRGSSIAQLTPETALTNSSGVASVTITPASVISVGAASVEVTAEVDGASISGSKDFSVQAANIALSPVRVGNTTLVSGGNTSLSVTALLGGSPAAGRPVNISFSASCGRINEGVGSVTTDGSGVASAVYSAVQADGSPCSGSINVTASTAGATSVVTSINVAAPVANAITFVSASPQQLFVAGSGAIEQAQLRFRVFSSSLAPIANQTVELSIVTNPGGVGLNASGSTAPVTGTTNSLGEVAVSVFAGTIPGAIKVRASLPGTLVFAESQNLTVASGPPSQRFFSLSVETFNIEGAVRDGVSTQLTARVADRQGNAVEDGTIVNFTSEGGQVGRSCATQRTNNIASCSVTFSTQDPRPLDGRVSVLAYAEGTKDYVDNNGDNSFNAGDALIDIGDAYRDDNENSLFDSAGEFVLPRASSLACLGAGAPAPARANTCDGLLATTVRKQSVILFSSSQPSAPSSFDQVPPPGAAIVNEVSFQLASRENTRLPMPAGTTVAATVVDNTLGNGLSCTSVNLFGSPVANVAPGNNPMTNLSTRITVLLKDCAPDDLITFTVTSPSGLQSRLDTYRFR